MNILVNFSTLSDDHSRFLIVFTFSSDILLLCLDVLLCHDDELEGRRVAFILYLVPQWQSSDGGTLDLYSTDSEFPILVYLRIWSWDKKIVCNLYLFLVVCFFEKGNFQPQSIVKSLVPSLNTLVLFEVSPVSFHQVRGTAPFHRSCTSGCRTLRTCCVCQGLRGFGRGQVSSVAERLVSWPIHRTSSASCGSLHPKKPTHTQRCKTDLQQKQYLRFILNKQLFLLTKTSFLCLWEEPC